MAWTAMCHDPLPVGGIAVGLLVGTHALLGLPVSGPLLVAAGCGAALVYGVDRVFVDAPEDRWNRPDRVDWVRAHRRWLVVEGGVLGIVGGVALFFLRPATIVGAVLLGVVAAGRHVLSEKGRVWTTGWAKPFAIAAVWAVGGTALPMIEAGLVQGPALAWLGAYRILFVLPNVLLSDWGDRRGDRRAGLRPWGQHVREGHVRWGATIVLVAALGLVPVGRALGVPLPLLLVDAVGPVLLLGGVWVLNPERTADRLVLDLIVAWPLVPALLAWMIV